MRILLTICLVFTIALCLSLNSYSQDLKKKDSKISSALSYAIDDQELDADSIASRSFMSSQRNVDDQGNIRVYIRLYEFSDENIEELLKVSEIDLQHPSEISLGLHLVRFAEVLEMMSRDLLPNRLTDYLYELATKFNVFFRDCQVIGSSEQDARLILCHLTEKIMKTGFDILGLHPLMRM